jgi:hypothetical protein
MVSMEMSMTCIGNVPKIITDLELQLDEEGNAIEGAPLKVDFSRLLLKQALAAWGQKEKVGVQAFLVIRSMALACPFPFIELTFKGCYIAFGRHACTAPPHHHVHGLGFH